MLQYVSKGEHDDRWYFSAYDQCWDGATLKELWEEHNIIFMPDGIDAVHAVMIVKREGEHPLISIGVEDDGTLYFDRRYGFFKHAFDSYWIDSLVKTLLEAKARMNEKELNESSTCCETCKNYESNSDITGWCNACPGTVIKGMNANGTCAAYEKREEE